MGGQIYGKEYSFPMITPKLIFSLIALSVHFHSGGGAAFPTKGEGLGMWKGRGILYICLSVFLFYLFSKSVFICIGFSNIGQIRL